jgi:tetratricopeptide (TPR) repeat protein
LLDRIALSSERLVLARDFEAAGEADAANFVRRETLRRVSDFVELERLGRQLMADEPAADDDFDRAYAGARNDEARLAVVRRFLTLSPHSTRARGRLIALLEALGHKELLFNEIAKFRAEPLADAGLLAAAGASLRRIGFDEEGRKVFGELVERAPRDPWTLAFVGDRLRAEGLFDEALAVYERLSRALPGDAGASLRLSLAHAGAGRLDVATRLLDRVSQTGGRDDDGRLAELSSVLRAVSLSRARGGHGAEVDAELERRLLETPLPDVAGVILVQSPPSGDPIAVHVRRERGEAAAQTPDLDASEIGLAALRIERGEGSVRILLSRAAEPGRSRPVRALVSALVLSPERGLPKLVVREVEVARDGKPVELRFEGERLL